MKSIHTKILVTLLLLVQNLIFANSEMSEILEISTDSTITPWMVVMKKEDKIVYIVGSFHVGPKRFRNLPEYITKNSKKSDVIAFEYLHKEEEKGKGKGKGKRDNSINFLPKGESLFDYFTKHEVAKLESILGEDVSSAHTPRYYFNRLQGIRNERMNLKLSEGFEYVILHNEKNINKRPRNQFVSLQEKQSNFGAVDDYAHQAKTLRYLLNNFDLFLENAKKAFSAWMAGNTEFLAEQFEFKKNMYTEKFFQVALYDRNKVFAHSISKHHKKHDSIFAACGNMHMFGDLSVVEHLKKLGYQIVEEYPRKYFLK